RSATPQLSVARHVPMAKLPTRSPTHQDVEPSRLATMGLELEDIATDGEVALPALIELAEDRGRPASHYLAALALASELRVASDAPLVVRVCAGTCQRYGALDLLDHLVDRASQRFAIMPVSCLDRCDLAPACEVHGDHGVLVIAPATTTALDEAVGSL
ncbi:MAG TPA: (2Fe-2S) ferredoxin domain-containing protein, partial [Kofleriaceae bacterium]|nr:(2Fe-2S) ferredoxin domain-containing protein [Kofleriaceae bacterium]